VRAVAVVVAMLVAVAVACLRTVSYECSDDSFCQRAGVQGTCEATSYCSFPDPACPDGKRYASVGPNAGQCVGSGGGAFRVGGVASGVSGSGLVLADNGSDMLPVGSNGPFTFMRHVATGATYAVTVVTPPPTTTCTVGNGSGTMGSADVSNVTVSCSVTGTPGITCGSAFCSPLATELCCHNKTDTTGSCQQVGSSCAAGSAQQSCDDSGDCGGLPNICCVHLNSSGSIKNPITCVAGSASCTASGTDTVDFLCDPAAATPCPGSMSCVADATHGWHRCQ
jgi:hypothetical protein